MCLLTPPSGPMRESEAMNSLNIRTPVHHFHQTCVYNINDKNTEKLVYLTPDIFSHLYFIVVCDKENKKAQTTHNITKLNIKVKAFATENC